MKTNQSPVPQSDESSKETRWRTPIEEKQESFIGKFKGMIHFSGDIMAPLGEVWDADC